MITMVSQEKVKECIELYQLHRYKEHESYLQQYSAINKISSLVYRATWGKLIDGSTHQHQRRVKKEAKRQMVIKIRIEIDVILQLTDFHSIWSRIENLRVDGYGDLAVYDCALRLASTKGIYPTYVYIHQESKTGAEILLQRSLTIERYISPKELIDIYPSIKELQPHHLENFLCIYCDDFLDEDEE